VCGVCVCVCGVYVCVWCVCVVCVCVCVCGVCVCVCTQWPWTAKHRIADRSLGTPALKRTFAPGTGTRGNMLQSCLCAEIGLFIMRLGNTVESFVWKCPVGKLW